MEEGAVSVPRGPFAFFRVTETNLAQEWRRCWILWGPTSDGLAVVPALAGWAAAILRTCREPLLTVMRPVHARCWSMPWPQMEGLVCVERNFPNRHRPASEAQRK